MGSEIKSWQVVDGTLVPVECSLPSAGRKEREDLEQWIKSNPAVLGDDILLIGEQVQTSTGVMDFLGVDSSGNTVIVELKRDKLPRDVLAQIIDYASDVADWDMERFRMECSKYTGQSFEDVFQQRFEDVAIEDLPVNQAQRLLLVGFGVDSSLNRMIEWLSDRYSVGINAVVLSYVKTRKGDEILSRMVVIPEELVKQKTDRKKFKIEMSDEPGKYDDDKLRDNLKLYLSNGLYSSQRIRDYFLPILLEKGQITRDELRKEFVRRQAAKDESQAGYFISLISVQLGHKPKDYLRQVISYEYPNHPWEKDNFRIRGEYVQLVRDVLDELKPRTS